jgi:rsbT co-antagonist protein RsbR
MAEHASGALHAAVTIEELGQRLRITPVDLENVRRFGRFAAEHVTGYIEHFYEWMAKQPEYVEFFSDAARLERAKRLQVGHWGELFRDPFGEKHVASCRRVAEVHARIGLSLPAYLTALDVSLQFYMGLAHPTVSAEELPRLHRSVMKLVHADATMVLDSYTRLTQQTISEQTRALVEMSTPVATLWDDILMLPIVGIIDSKRAQDIMTSSLRRIADTRAKVFILDISGVSVVDTAVANHIIKVTRATRLMGCQSLLSGVSPAIAQTIVALGIDVGALQTKATLRDALEEAFQFVGLKVTRAAER